jgi:signal transduction histidine kinase
VYLIVVVGVGALVGMRDHVSLLPLLAAGAVALAFQPVRVRLQRLADRVVYGRRATRYDALAALSRPAADTVPSEQLLTDTARAICDAVGVPSASVWLGSGAECRVVAHWPADAAPEIPFPGPAGTPGVRVFPVHNQGVVLGAIAVKVRPGRTLSSADERLLADVASQAGLLFRNLGLSADLVARVGELRESRRRLVTAQEEERRRIERNLHDGAQQDLFGLKVNIRQVRTLWQRNPESVHPALERLEEEAEKALATVKELARGVYPPLLTAQGIVGALRARARKAPVGVRISNSSLGRYPADVEEAVYFVCSEALQNAVKHAHPTVIRISLAQRDGELTFEVKDDGRGFDPAVTTGGAGMQSMRDRVDVVGGSMEIVSRPGTGTTVKGHVIALPLGETAPDTGAARIGEKPESTLVRRSG